MMKQRGFQLINPTEKWFPGLNEIREKYASWDWCISKTPKFTVQKQLQLKSDEQEHGVQLKVNVVEVSPSDHAIHDVRRCPFKLPADHHSSRPTMA